MNGTDSGSRVEGTISEQLADEVLALQFEDLPEAVVRESKRRVLDTLACAVGGYDSPPSRAILQVIHRLGGPAESTVCGGGSRTSSMNAALANGVMVRFTEAVDRAIEGPGGVTQHGHPCEVIPGILAVAEAHHTTGRDVIVAIVLGYELMSRLSYAVGGAQALEKMGWKHEVRAGLVVPLVVGRLMGLTRDQMVNAAGIAGCYSGGLGLLDHGAEEVTMARNLRFPYAAYQAILAASMAQQGLTGPSRVFEGHNGFVEVICRGTMDLGRVTARQGDFSILHTSTKLYPVNGRLLPQTEALLHLVTKHDIRPDDIAQVRISTTPRVLEGMANPATHKYPKTKETADHSAYYVAALAVLDREIRLDLTQFSPERLGDPQIRRMIDKIELVAEADPSPGQPPTVVEISMTSGDVYHHTVRYPKGHVLNPLTDDELRAKFTGFASRLMSESQMKALMGSIDRLDELEDIGKLMRFTVFH